MMLSIFGVLICHLHISWAALPYSFLSYYWILSVLYIFHVLWLYEAWNFKTCYLTLWFVYVYLKIREEKFTLYTPVLVPVLQNEPSAINTINTLLLKGIQDTVIFLSYQWHLKVIMALLHPTLQQQIFVALLRLWMSVRIRDASCLGVLGAQEVLDLLVNSQSQGKL